MEHRGEIQLVEYGTRYTDRGPVPVWYLYIATDTKLEADARAARESWALRSEGA